MSNKVGNRIKKVENGTATEYTYNNLNQLTEETIGDKTITYAYDTNGNLICKGDDTDYESYTYTADNMLASATIHKGNTETVETYTYDGEGNRLRKVVKKKIPVNEDEEDGESTSEGGEANTISAGNTEVQIETADTTGEITYEEQLVEDTWYVTDSTTGYSQVLMELDADKNIKVSYTRGDGLISRTENETSQYYVADGHGDIRFLMEEEGKITDTYTYTSYGEMTEKTGNTDNPYLYTGEYYDENTGFYYLRARYMNPETGSFISLDTYQGNAYDPASLHKYNYAQNNPQMYNDPSGHFVAAIQLAASTASSEILSNMHSLHVMGMVSGMINSIVSQVFSTGDDAMTAFIKGYMTGFCMGAAYTGAFAIATLFNILPQLQLLMGLVAINQAALSLAFSIVCLFQGNYTAAAGYAVLGVFSILDAFVALDLSGYVKLTTPKGEMNISVKAHWQNNVDDVIDGACFTEGTEIKTAEGSKNIEDIEVGDLVYAKNTETGETGWKKVAKLFRREINELVHLKIGDESIETTPEHPFWVEGEGFKAAGELEEGEYVQTADGKILQVVKVQKEYLKEPVTVYNFEVEDWHTYYVSDEEVLVHNTCMMPKGGNGSDIPWSSGGVSDAAKQLESGAKSVTVSNRAQAEELFLGIYQGDGYVNVTGMDAMDAKNLLGGKGNTYHWDDVFGADGYLLGHGAGNKDAMMPHLQIHQKKGYVIRIFFDN